MSAERLKKGIGALLIAGVYLLAWQLLSMAVGSALLLPPPFATIKRFFELLFVANSWARAGATLLRVLCGYAAGVAIGLALAILSACFKLADALLSPLRSIVKATPVTSFILLALLWLRSSVVPAFIACLTVIPIVWMNVLESVRTTDVRLLEMARVFDFSRSKTVRCIYAPHTLPQFLAACTTALGFAWKSGVAAEIIAQPQLSIGYSLYEAKLHIETVDLFAWTMLVVLLSMLIETLLVYLLRLIPHDTGK